MQIEYFDQSLLHLLNERVEWKRNQSNHDALNVLCNLLSGGEDKDVRFNENKQFIKVKIWNSSELSLSLDLLNFPLQ